jgi:fructose-1,6-bisphosphatase/inositol monophosphatase family enzyme
MYQTELNVSLALAKEAGDIIKTHFHSFELRQDFKDSNTADVVTQIDRQVEELLHQRLALHFPSYGFIGEESTSQKGLKVDRTVLQQGRHWVIDPIDGTSNFVHGHPFVCVSIGLLDQGNPVLGVVYNPILNELFHAVLDGGAYLNGQRLSCQRPLPLSLSCALMATEYGSNRDPAIVHSCLSSIQNVILSPTRGIRSMGSAALTICYVARGSLDGYWEAGVHIWDIAAAMVILLESGGTMCNFDPISTKIDLCCRKFVAIRKGNSDSLLNELLKCLQPIRYASD